MVTTGDGETISTADVKIKVTSTNEAPPLYIVDGKIMAAEELKKIDAKEISRIDVLKGEKAIAEFGELGKNGVIKVTLKK